MKTIKLLIIALLLVSCSKDSVDEEGCECLKETYTYEQGATIGSNGLPVSTFNRVTLSIEEVVCQDEQEQTSLGNNNYFVIECN